MVDFNCSFSRHFIIYLPEEDDMEELRACVICGTEESTIAEEFEAVVLLTAKGLRVR